MGEWSAMMKQKHDKQSSQDGNFLLNLRSPAEIKEAYVKLRTNLMFCMTADGTRNCKVFAVTGANQGEGKSITAANIAISFAMIGKKTLLLDADMRSSSQRRIWKNRTLTGLSDFLAEIKPLEVFSVKELPLSIVFTGTLPPNPSELLSSEKMSGFVKECSNRFDYIIIDTSPYFNELTAEILLVSDLIIIPTEIEVDSLDAMTTTINELNYLCGGQITFKLLFTKVESLKTIENDIEELDTIYVDHRFQTYIRYHKYAVQRARKYHQPLAKRYKMANVTKDYKALAKEIIKEGI